MKILITGICGFVGSTLARELAQAPGKPEIVGIDNLSRAGCETNRAELKRLGVKFFHGDLRLASDVNALAACEWVIDAAANPSVLAGIDGQTSPRQLVEHNLSGTVNLLEYCKRHKAGFVLLSTSRVYSIPPFAALAMKVESSAFRPDFGAKPPPGASAAGVDETFSTAAPVSLYGATKVASEALALEYGEAFGLPVFINRCGVLAGAGQFGRPDQGIFAFWINSWIRRRPLKYIGFDGQGHQVRDCLHPRDLVPLLQAQFQAPRLSVSDRIVNVGGGIASARSLRQLSDWCAGKFGAHEVSAGPASRAFDLPWIVLDCAKAGRIWQWRPQTSVDAILEEIAVHAGSHPDWLELSAG